MRTTPPINLTKEQKDVLEAIDRSRQLPHSLVQRSRMILNAGAGKTNKAISTELGIQEETVGLWRKRWLAAEEALSGCGGSLKELRGVVEKVLSDAERPGAPPTFSAEQVCRLIALACETPPDDLTHWSRHDLAREAVKRGLVETISASSIGRFLKSGATKGARSE